MDEKRDRVFREALEYLKQKAVVSYKEFSDLPEEYRNLVFTVKGYTKAEVLDKFMDELQAAMENGTTKEAFRNKMNTFLENKGYQGVNPYHADLVFRQNIQTAYNVGHYRQMTDPDVLAQRKYWQYQTAGDGKVRETHQAMDGRVFLATDEIWNTWYPPNGFGCRCTVVSLTPAQVKRKGLVVSDKLPDMVDLHTGEITAALPDKKFRTNPAKAGWTPDVSGFPEALRKIYSEAQNTVLTDKK